MGILVRRGLVLAADSRSNAGVDHIATLRKFALFERPGERVMALPSAGNLATTQGRDHPADAAPRGGARLRQPGRRTDHVQCRAYGRQGVARDRGARRQARASPWRSECHFPVGRLAARWSASAVPDPSGRQVHRGAARRRFLQAGETKCGKPILDRVITHEASLAAAAKCALLSFDATMRSNLSVAPPIDLLCYREGSLRAEVHSIADDYAYFGKLRARYGRGILELLERLPDPDWIAANER